MGEKEADAAHAELKQTYAGIVDLIDASGVEEWASVWRMETVTGLGGNASGKSLTLYTLPPEFQAQHPKPGGNASGKSLTLHTLPPEFQAQHPKPGGNESGESQASNPQYQTPSLQILVLRASHKCPNPWTPGTPNPYAKYFVRETNDWENHDSGWWIDATGNKKSKP
jgi:hypothetical protein